VKKLVLALVLAVTAALLVPVSASAAPSVNLHNVNLRNRTIPGKTCYSPSPIKLHKGHGQGGTYADGEKLFVDSYGKPVYGDLTHDGQDEAFLFVTCSTGGGTAASIVKSSWVVFTAGSGKVKVLGVISAKHQWLNSNATVLSDPKITGGVAHVRETIWFPEDPTCCGTGKARTAWWYHNGTLRVKSTKLTITDQIVSAKRVGHAALGATVAQLKAKYGTLHHEELATGGCDIYWHGKQSTSFGALIDPSSKGKVFGIYAPTDSVTRAGIGDYSSVKQVKHAYAGHTIKRGTSDAGKQIYVKSGSSWFGFSLKKDSGVPGYYVRSIRIGTHAFVTGAHTCSS
jgi:hypothetical protein